MQSADSRRVRFDEKLQLNVATIHKLSQEERMTTRASGATAAACGEQSEQNRVGGTEKKWAAGRSSHSQIEPGGEAYDYAESGQR